MRSLLFPLPLLAACATEQGETPYDGYDPNADVDAPAVSEEMPSQGAEADAAWKNPSGTVFAGFAAPQTGRWTWPGQEVGLASGDAACRALGANHVCTDAELSEAKENGDFKDAPAGRTFWYLAKSDPQAADCHGFTYTGNHISDGNFGTVDAGAYALHAAPYVAWDERCLHDPEACPAVVPSGFPCNVTRGIACCF